MIVDMESLRRDAFAFLVQKELEQLGDTPFASFVRAIIDLDMRADIEGYELVESVPSPAAVDSLDADPVPPRAAPLPVTEQTEAHDNPFANQATNSETDTVLMDRARDWTRSLLNGNDVIPQREQFIDEIVENFAIHREAARQIYLHERHTYDKQLDAAARASSFKAGLKSDRGAAIAAGWTPERRAAAAERMRQMRSKSSNANAAGSPR